MSLNRDKQIKKRHEIEKAKHKNYTFHKRNSIPQELILKFQVMIISPSLLNLTILKKKAKKTLTLFAKSNLKNWEVFLIKRELVNSKIDITLRLYNELNEKLVSDKYPIVEFFHEMKLNVIKILNEIVKYYVFRNPNKITYEGRDTLYPEI